MFSQSSNRLNITSGQLFFWTCKNKMVPKSCGIWKETHKLWNWLIIPKNWLSVEKNTLSICCLLNTYYQYAWTLIIKNVTEHIHPYFVSQDSNIQKYIYFIYYLSVIAWSNCKHWHLSVKIYLNITSRNIYKSSLFRKGF